ncbi:MAG: RDD family protein [Micropruina sp.]|uniref:RDD family protein n=1 Tax=Micropruina sp. TaxID=2737536 RepID=UPI0039E67C17
MSNQTWNNDPKPDESGDNTQNQGGYPPAGNAPDQGSEAIGYNPPSWDAGSTPAPSGPSGTDAPSGGYQPPAWDSGTTGSGADAPQGGYNAPGYGQGYSAPSGASGTDAPQGGYSAPGYGQGYSAPSGSDAASSGYGQPPTTPDQSFGQTPSYGAPTQDAYGQAPGQGGYDPNAGGYGSAPQGNYGQGAPGYGQEQQPYGAPQDGGYGAPGAYGAAPSPYGGGYQPNPYASSGPVLATWGRRAIGGLIDFLVPGIAIGLLVGLVLPNSGYGANLLSTLLAVGWWAYNTGYRVATTGYSFGHKIAKVRVVMEDSGQTPPQNTAILRAVAHFLDSLVCALGFLFPLWDAKKQTFADKIAKTVVIDEQNVQR